MSLKGKRCRISSIKQETQTPTLCPGRNQGFTPSVTPLMSLPSKGDSSNSRGPCSGRSGNRRLDKGRDRGEGPLFKLGPDSKGSSRGNMLGSES